MLPRYSILFACVCESRSSINAHESELRLVATKIWSVYQALCVRVSHVEILLRKILGTLDWGLGL